MGKTSRLKIRLREVRREMARLGLPALLVTDPANVAYLTGFTGSAGAALVTAERLALVVDFRYFEQAGLQAPLAELVHVERALYDEALAGAIAAYGVRRLAFEADALEVARHMAIAWRLPRLELVPTRGIVERGREVKDGDELASLRRAAEITSQAIVHALSLARPGTSERALAAALEAEFWRLGADGPAFPTLVASGPRTALPHPRPGDRLLEPGDWLLVDAGARYDGYCADMTRTVVVGTPDARQRAAWDAVAAALAAGLAAVRPGARTAAVDAACRKALAARGWSKAFGHATGHGVGLDVHEAPRIVADSDEVLAPGMVITVEPGLYEPGWGGVRLEQLVLVTADGAEVLTTAPIGPVATCGSKAGSL